MLIFILQSVWLYISELAGKDLEVDIVLKFLLYVTPRLLILVLPLTILLASIMVFGSFAENYEFAAMKSTGTSLQRAMRSLSVFIIGLAITTFFFANNVIPWAEYNFYNLRKNLQKVKPAMVIAEGQFNQIGELNIKVEEKSGDRGQYLNGVTIHKKKGIRNENLTVIKSKTGELISSEASDVLQLVLYEGNYYDDLQPKELKERRKRPHVKSDFEKYTINVDLSEVNNVNLDEKNYSSRYNMLNARDLNYTIDTLLTDKNKKYRDLGINMYNRSTASTLSINIEPKAVDTPFDGNSVYDLFEPKKNIQLIDGAINSINSTQAILASKKKLFALGEKNINKHIIAFHEKFALGFACIILFFIGAPLGALIKKGGLGLPIIIAIVLFLTYHFIGIFAKNSAEDSSLNPILATWLSTLIMLPLSIYLTSRATKDRALFDLDSLLLPIKNLISKSSLEVENLQSELNHESKAYIKLADSSDKKLIDVIKNYRQYDLDQSHKNSALQILESRGVTKEELRFGGNLVNENYENALRYKKAYDENSRITFIFYITSLILWISGAVLNNNGFPTLGIILMVIGGVTTLLYLIAYAKSFMNQSNFYKILQRNIMSNAIVLIVLGIPLYFLYKIYFKKKMQDDLKEIR